MRSLATLLGLGLGLMACDQETDPSDFVPTMTHSFEPLSVDVGEEVSGVCQSWTLGNDASLYVSEVRQRNDGAWHHSNWFFVPEVSSLRSPPKRSKSSRRFKRAPCSRSRRATRSWAASTS
jgi:hypothetical protein